MNSKQRYHATTHYGSLDHLFRWEMGPFPETVRRWHAQGLPEDSDWNYYGGMDRFERAPVAVGLCPGFEFELLEDLGEHEVYRDGDGVVKKRLKNVPPPGMPQYLEYPLKGRKNWPDFKRRLDPPSPKRFPPHWESRKLELAHRDYPLGITAGSLYGTLRNWMGVEGISYMLYDDPAFLSEAAADMTDCILAVLDRALDGMTYDYAVFWEDMAYKTASLINPRDYRRIFLPHYRRIADRLRRAGTDALMLDSDGNVEELIPCWLDTGINIIYPFEVAAGMDVVQMRRKFGKALVMAGGMDKRVLTTDRESIRKMVEARRQLIEEGGYIPGVDHAIPPDVPWDNYLYYRELLA
ncbi:MAG: hypothetical protein JXE06_08545, partial [Coriobacteriia bacterium]|nr:hypothetical protein [Coriobacteriia bacterium]